MVGGAVGLMVAGVFLTGALRSWSDRATDRLFLSREPDMSVVIVAIDDASLGVIGRWPWPRSVHAKLIRTLSEAGASAIAYDVNFPEPSDEWEDASLADAIRQAGNVVLPVELSVIEVAGRLVFDPAATLTPIPILTSVARAIGHSNTPMDPDGVVRRVPVGIHAPDGSEVRAFSVQALDITSPDIDVRKASMDRAYRVVIGYAGPPKRTYQTVAAADVLAGAVPPAVFRGRAVFVGSTAPDLHDDRLVPTSDGTPMPGVEIHASFYDTLKNAGWLTPIPPYALAGGLFLVALLVALLAAFLHARIGAPLTVVLWIALLISAFFLFDRGWIMDVVWPTLAIAFSYAAVTLERRITSDRERARLRDAISRYVTPSVVSRILKDPSTLKLGGEKRRMSVLFSDIRGFTSIAEGMPPERLVEVMNLYLTRMTDVVFEHEGVLDKYIGDAVMAFWNAPIDQKDHALRSVRTAVAMQEEVTDLNRSKLLPKGVKLKIGIGINTGDMIVGNMGSEARFDYTVIGDDVNLASRLESLTKEYDVGILVSEATYMEVQDQVLARRIDRVAVKGKSAPVLVYEILGMEGSVSARDRITVAAYEEALDAYFASKFDDAITKCEALATTAPKDGPCQTLIRRAGHMKEHRPPPGWNGVWVMHSK
ncbi:adenylate/guanylate cyclase domain-containing protein [Patescibacteria group bacterium]|nr:adenylate/guanylate cyclase domain-containing protein [Patescibacteria group bacterium]